MGTGGLGDFMNGRFEIGHQLNLGRKRPDLAALNRTPEMRQKRVIAATGRKFSEEERAGLSGANHWAWMGSRVDYTGAHERAQAALAGFPCLACGSPKNVECALITGAGESRSIKKCGMRYSSNPDNYLPLCWGCHKKYDAAGRP